jgi:hypothetical protein
MASLAFTTTGIITALVVVGILIFCCCKGQFPKCNKHQNGQEQESYSMKRLLRRYTDSKESGIEERPPASQQELTGGTPIVSGGSSGTVLKF